MILVLIKQRVVNPSSTSGSGIPVLFDQFNCYHIIIAAGPFKCGF